MPTIHIKFYIRIVFFLYFFYVFLFTKLILCKYIKLKHNCNIHLKIQNLKYKYNLGRNENHQFFDQLRQEEGYISHIFKEFNNGATIFIPLLIHIIIKTR